MAKKFKQVNAGDFIYMLNPMTLKIDALRVKEIRGLREEAYRGAHPSELQKKSWVEIDYYRSEKILQVTDLSLAHTVKAILDGDETIMLVPVKMEGQEGLMPVPYSADKKELLKWMTK